MTTEKIIDITEGQCGKQVPSDYRFVRIADDGLHLFQEAGTPYLEAFAQRQIGSVSGWHLEYEGHWYEFVCSRHLCIIRKD
jgi:hypothetical protein